MTEPATIGSCGKAHGIRGEVAVFTSMPELFAPGTELQSDRGVLTVAAARPHKGHLLVGFQEIADRNEAEGLRNLDLRIPGSELPELPEGQFWVNDLVGLAAHTPDGASLGVVAAVATAETQDRLVIDTGEGQVEVPFVSELVPEVTDTYVVIDPPAGLFD